MDSRIRGVGVDIVEVARIARLVESRGSFTRRWFSDVEVADCAAADRPPERFAELLAAKEAAWKALGIAWSGRVPWKEMHVADSDAGQVVRVSGEVARAAAEVGVDTIDVETACDGRIALATALAWTGSVQGCGRVGLLQHVRLEGAI